MGDGTGSYLHDPTCYVVLGKLSLTSESSICPWEERAQHLPERMRLRAGKLGGLEGTGAGKKSPSGQSHS